MLLFMRKLTPFFLVFFTLCFVEAGIMADYSDARSRGGGRTFKRSTPAKRAPATQKQQPSQKQQKSGFSKGLMGGLLGGAIGGMLFGSLFGMGGTGMGILPLLLLGVVGYFFYKRMSAKPRQGASTGYQPPPTNTPYGQSNTTTQGGFPPPPPPQEEPAQSSVDEGIAVIQIADPDFDPSYFVEVASDVFFKVQAGWMRRDLASYQHLLGGELAEEYKKHFADMEAKGEINKLENISIRKVEIVNAGSENGEDFVNVLFTANLLDYTVNDQNGELISGSMTDPVKFAEEWSWARPIGTQDWRLEGIEEV